MEYYSWSGARGVSRYQGLLLRTAAARAAVLALYCVTVPAIMLSSTTVDIRKRQLEISLLFSTFPYTEGFKYSNTKRSAETTKKTLEVRQNR